MFKRERRSSKKPRCYKPKRVKQATRSHPRVAEKSKITSQNLPRASAPNGKTS